jgi:hypothetical protein
MIGVSRRRPVGSLLLACWRPLVAPSRCGCLHMWTTCVINIDDVVAMVLVTRLSIMKYTCVGFLTRCGMTKFLRLPRIKCRSKEVSGIYDMSYGASIAIERS